jgi:hypothetical protein
MQASIAKALLQTPFHGKGANMFRKFVRVLAAGSLPGALMAADSTAAMMYTNRGLGEWECSGPFVSRVSWRLGSNQAGFGSQNQCFPVPVVSVGSDSLVKFDSNSPSVDHGAVAVTTSKSMATKAGEVSLAPATGAPGRPMS